MYGSPKASCAAHSGKIKPTSIELGTNRPVRLTGEVREPAWLSMAALRSGRDGHRAVLSWGELDPEFGNTAALLAVSMDCRALDEQGPHLVMPGDRCGARHVSQVTDIRVCADDRLWG